MHARARQASGILDFFRIAAGGRFSRLRNGVVFFFLFFLILGPHLFLCRSILVDKIPYFAVRIKREGKMDE